MLFRWTIIFLTLARTYSQSTTYYFLAVSGGLQDGFPDHVKMDFRRNGEYVPAIYIGKALVRGTKAFLDVMEPSWRQYSPEPEQPLINSVVMVSGCHEHANQYWVYAVDSRQFLTILNNEPRFLSITPDTGLVDLTVPETSTAVKTLALHEIRKQGKQEEGLVALPIVVATWYHASFVPSPPIRYTSDGSSVTNFPESLAKWANVDDSDRTAGCDDDVNEVCDNSEESLKAQERYWSGIRKAVREAESNRLPHDELKANGPPFACNNQTRLGVSPGIARINYSFTVKDLETIFLGYKLDTEKATLRVK